MKHGPSVREARMDINESKVMSLCLGNVETVDGKKVKAWEVLSDDESCPLCCFNDPSGICGTASELCVKCEVILRHSVFFREYVVENI